MLFTLTAEQATIWQNYDCSLGAEASILETQDPLRPSLFINTADI